MPSNKIIIANWKMNPASKKEAEKIFEETKKGVQGSEVEVVVCPPFVFLASLGGLALGAQNVFYEEKGAFTGEISAIMLKNLGVDYVIIGHSERRKYFGETDEVIKEKIKKSLEAGLKVIFCIGETEEERELGKKEEVLEKQLKLGLNGVSDFGFCASNLVIAYEPVWAIGTGNNCSVQETKETTVFIRKFLPEGVRVLYGGSVKSNNSSAYIKEAGADGLLVGGASLDSEEFVKIIKSAE